MQRFQEEALQVEWSGIVWVEEADPPAKPDSRHRALHDGRSRNGKYRPLIKFRDGYEEFCEYRAFNGSGAFICSRGVLVVGGNILNEFQLIGGPEYGDTPTHSESREH